MAFYDDQTHDLKSTKLINNRKITVYLTLIARGKHWKNKMGEYDFTVMLDKIFTKIKEQKDYISALSI